MHMLGMLHAPEGLVENEKRNDYQRERIHERRQHSGAAIAVGLGRAGRTAFEIYRDQRQQECEQIGEIVSRL